MQTREEKIKAYMKEPLYPLPNGVNVIWHSDSILPFGVINFLKDTRTKPTDHLLKYGPFFATNHPIRELPQLLVKGCQTLAELEEKVYQEIWNGNATCFEKVLLRTALDGSVPSQELADAVQNQISTTIKTRTPREYFQSAGEYLVDLTVFP
jgi:hypothetical protein